MKKNLLIIAFIIGWSLQGQHTISGTFSPADEYQWMIAYRLNPGTQVYVADTAINDGQFAINLPQNAIPGTYRLVYAVPQEEYFFDIIYNGQEDIDLAFNMVDGVSFKTSEENIIFNSYFKEINQLEQQIIDYYTLGSTNENELAKIGQQLNEVQNSYEEKSKGYIANQFTLANQPYIPSSSQTIQSYVKGKKENYFKGLDSSNPILQASGFLTNKLTNYVFTALPLETITPEESTSIVNSNVDTVNTRLSGVDTKYKLHLFYSLWSQAVATGQNQAADYIYSVYLKRLASTLDNQEIITTIEVYNRLRLGAVAPDLAWEKEGSIKNLSTLEEAEMYVLIFWSSTCGHCLNELPALQKELAKNEKVKVIAIGLEDDKISWKRESSKLNLFDHAIALGKWESDYAKLYDIHQTPTYFLLDKDKVIIAKPEDDRAVIEFIGSN